VKDVNLKESFSFTSDINVYETCPTQYKFYKELNFAPVRVSAMLFGKLVHQTIEDIHKAAIRKEEHLINPENIALWFETNYTALSKAEHSYLAETQKNAALGQVLKYAEKHADSWDKIKQAEVDISLVKDDYIIEGKIDLIRGKGKTVEIVDFKSEKKPDLFSDSQKIERYKRQLQVYAYLVEERTGNKVSQMHIYYTGEDNGKPTISFPYRKSDITQTIDDFDTVVHHIIHKEFPQTARSAKTCAECDFRFYCNK
jgi:DNA helicase-2/ATP-dependent DNA helicase PcrA